MWVYLRVNYLYTVGFYSPKGDWIAVADFSNEIQAQSMVNYLNGGSKQSMVNYLNGGSKPNEEPLYNFRHDILEMFHFMDKGNVLDATRLFRKLTNIPFKDAKLTLEKVMKWPSITKP